MRLMSAALMLTLAAFAPSTAPATDSAPEAAPPAVDATPAEPAPPEMGPIVGGYGPASLEDEGVKAALKVATDEIYKREPTRALVEKTEAQLQVVAGLNYAFDITMSGGAHYKVVVYRPLGDAPLEVTEFTRLN